MQPMENNFLHIANGLLPSHWQKLWSGAFLDKSLDAGCMVGRDINNVTLRKVEFVTLCNVKIVVNFVLYKSRNFKLGGVWGLRPQRPI